LFENEVSIVQGKRHRDPKARMLTVSARRIARAGFFSLALLILAIALSVLNNNFSFSRLSRAGFANRLNHSLAASTSWTTDQYFSTTFGNMSATGEGIDLVHNSTLAYMLVDCAAMSDDPRLLQLIAKLRINRPDNPDLWARLVNPTITASPLSSDEMAALKEYQRWMLYGISPVAAPLSDAELADMFSPDKFRTGRATHQLISLYYYRKFNGDTPELNRVMSHVEERIAAEAAFDFRVTDLYLQRIAVLLATGRPDLVKPRWVERVLAAQQSDGGWHYNWYGWAPHPTSFVFSSEHSIAHSTAQGMWLTHMLKYRYPGWIDKNYK
jgi:hypothetical protein